MARVNINSATKGYSSHKFNPISLSTLDFSDLLPVRVIECVKGDSFSSIKGSGFLRLAPTIFPAYGRVKLNTAAFFVPENQLIHQSDAFHQNMSTFKGRGVVMPYFLGYQINEMFTLNSVATSSTVHFDVTDPIRLAYRIGDNNTPFYDTSLTDDSSFDFIYPFSPSAGTFLSGHYRLTHLGRAYFKKLKSLGYDFCSFMDMSYGSFSGALALCDFKVNALPLLAYCKIYIDMFLNPHLYNSSKLVALLKSIHDCEDYTWITNATYISSTGVLSSLLLSYILQEILVPFSHNLYLDAWNSPNSPDGVSPAMIQNTEVSDGLISPILPPSPSSSYTEHVVSNNVNGVFEQNNGTNGSITNMRYLSQYGLNWIDSFFKFVRRNNLFGSKAFERLFARFGIKSSDYNSQFVNKIYEGSDDIDFSAVLSQTDSYVQSTGDGKTLGSYAGYGAAGLNFEFSHKCDSFGYIIIVSWLSMIPIKPSGFNPSVLRISPLDFYSPEWDGKSLRAIPMCEVGFSKVPSTDNVDKKVYGFTDLYDDYRDMQDSVCGDFALDSNVKDFAFSRDLGFLRRGAYALKPLEVAVQYYFPWENGDLSNPFQFSRETSDRFYLQFNFDITAKRPVLSKSSALDLTGEGDIDIKLGGSQMS